MSATPPQKKPSAKPKRRPFCKELREPIYEPPHKLGGLAAASPLNDMLQPSLDEDREKRICKARIRKFELLYAHYSIDPQDPDRLSTLAIALALDFVPGVTSVDTPPKKPGRPRASALDKSWELANDVEELALRKRVSASQACTRIAKRITGAWAGTKSRALYARYLRHLDRLNLAPETRMNFLRSRLASAIKEPNQKPQELAGLFGIARLMLEEPVRRILDDPDGTKIKKRISVSK